MAEIDSFRALISLWDSPDALADEIGAPRAAVRKWKQRDRIPSERWGAILATDRARNFGLNAEKLIALASLEPTEVRL